MFVVVQYIDTFFTDYWLFCSIDAFFLCFYSAANEKTLYLCIVFQRQR